MKNKFSGKALNFSPLLFCLAVIVPAFVFFSCGRYSKIKSVAEEELFTMNYGNFEEEINLFGIKNAGNIRTDLTMRDGFFYIVNGEAGKILSLNSYGDLLSLYYSEDDYSKKNSGLPSKSTDGIWNPVEYPFEYTGKIAVDSRKYMYVVGTVPKERNEQDEDENLLYSQVVLCFSSDGTVVDYIGQQGPGGTPFPTIKGIYTTENNELVVVCFTNDGLKVFWFNTNGFLRYEIPVLASKVPLISPESVNYNASPSDLFVAVENVVPDSYSERLYVKIDYYIPFIDEESKVQSGVDYIQSMVYPLNIEKSVYEEPMNVPPFEVSITEDFSKISYSLPYDFLGVTRSNWFFFIITTENGFSVEMIQPGEQNVLKRQFDVNHSEILYYSFSLSKEGIISALLADRENARIVWWRTDELLDSILRQ